MKFYFRLIDRWPNYSNVEWRCQLTVSRISETLHVDDSTCSLFGNCSRSVISVGPQRSVAIDKTRLHGKRARFVYSLLAVASPSFEFQAIAAKAPCLLGMLIFENFISRYENFRSWDSSSTRNLTPHLAWTTHLMRECCNSVDIMPHGCGRAVAPGKWSEDEKLLRCQITKRARLSHVLVSCQTRPTDRCHPRLITRCGCNCLTMNSLSRTDRLGRGPCVQFRVIQQILIGYRCSVDKAADSTCVLFVEWRHTC